jgi:hypothetical protein
VEPLAVIRGAPAVESAGHRCALTPPSFLPPDWQLLVKTQSSCKNFLALDLFQIRAVFIRYLIVCLSLYRLKRSTPPLFQSGAALSPRPRPHARGSASQYGRGSASQRCHRSDHRNLNLIFDRSDLL